MKKSPIVGYVVTNRMGALKLCQQQGVRGKILLTSVDATVFPNRKAASKAIRDTQSHFESLREKFGDEWVNSHDYSIWRLRALKPT